ncbi:MAG: hypothetical protein R2764_22250 [Bacteroidales bacterium]
MKFKEFKDQTNEDKFYYNAIKEQLENALSGGHDVQLHIHSGYFNSRYENGKWNKCGKNMIWQTYHMTKYHQDIFL